MHMHIYTLILTVFAVAVLSLEAVAVEPPGAVRVSEFCFLHYPNSHRHSTSSSSPPSPNPIVCSKEMGTTLKRLCLTCSEFNFYSIFEMILWKVGAGLKGLYCLLPTAVLEIQPQLSNKDERGSKLLLQFVKSIEESCYHR